MRSKTSQHALGINRPKSPKVAKDTKCVDFWYFDPENQSPHADQYNFRPEGLLTSPATEEYLL